MLDVATPAIKGWFTTDPEPALIASRCLCCDALFFPPTAAYCRNPSCDSEIFEQCKLSRRGRIWSYTDARYMPPAPYVADAERYLPFAIAAVELPEGIVVLGQMADGRRTEDLSIGMEVELVVRPLYTDGVGERTMWQWASVPPVDEVDHER